MELTVVQARVVGSLVEKERTVPDTYPLTLNALLAACNQSSNRWPVLHLGEHEVAAALDELKQAGLVRFVYASHGGRSTRYRHVVGDALGSEPEEVALLAVLLLRGPQTAAELRARAERLHPFASVGEVEQVLAGLAGRPEPLAVRLARQPGQKEERWAQLLTGVPDPTAVEAAGAGARGPGVSGADTSALQGDVEALQAGVATLHRELREVRERLGRLEAELGLASPAAG